MIQRKDNYQERTINKYLNCFHYRKLNPASNLGKMTALVATASSVTAWTKTEKNCENETEVIL